MILLTFLRHSDHTAASVTTHILCLLSWLPYNWSYMLVYDINLQFEWSCLLGHHFPTLLDTSYLHLRKFTLYEFCVFLWVLHVLQFWSYHTLETHPGHSKSQINHIIDTHQQHHVFLLRSAIVHINSEKTQSTSTKAHQIWQLLVIRHYIHFVLMCQLDSETRSKKFYLLIFLSRQLFLWTELVIAGFACLIYLHLLKFS